MRGNTQFFILFVCAIGSGMRKWFSAWFHQKLKWEQASSATEFLAATKLLEKFATKCEEFADALLKLQTP